MLLASIECVAGQSHTRQASRFLLWYHSLAWFAIKISLIYEEISNLTRTRYLQGGFSRLHPMVLYVCSVYAGAWRGATGSENFLCRIWCEFFSQFDAEIKLSLPSSYASSFYSYEEGELITHRSPSGFCRTHRDKRAHVQPMMLAAGFLRKTFLWRCLILNGSFVASFPAVRPWISRQK